MLQISALQARTKDRPLQNSVVEIPFTACYMTEMTGHDVKALRESLGLSRREFAKALKVSHMMIYRAEAGSPSRALVLYIERALADGSLKLSDRKIKPE